MARQRMLHPDFFTDPKVVRCSFAARLLFQGLWCLADREGRCEADPFALKLKLLPADSVDVEALLVELDAAHLIRRYSVGAGSFLLVPGFVKRQRPHPKEIASTIPAPPQEAEITHAVKLHGPTTPKNEGLTSKSILPAESFPSGSSFPSFPSESVMEQEPPPQVKERIPFVIEPPTTPPETWGAEEFWRWAQNERQKARLLAEQWPHPSALSTWWSAARGQCGDVEALQEAFLAYGDDPYWQKKKPPLPWHGFASQWARFVPIGGANASA